MSETRRQDAPSGPPLVVRLGIPALIGGGLLLVLAQQGDKAAAPAGPAAMAPPRPAAIVVTEGVPRPFPPPAAPGASHPAVPAATPATPPVFRDPRALVVEPPPAAEARPTPAVAAAGPAAPTPVAVQPGAVPAPAARPPGAKAPSVALEAVPPPAPGRPEVVAAAATPPAPPPGAVTAAACGAPDLMVVPLSAGRMQLRVTGTPCRAGQDIRVAYGGLDLVRALGADGGLVAELDLFAGDRRSADVLFADGTRRVVPTLAHDLDRLSKVAVAWKAPVDLDLHVWEPAGGGQQLVHLSPERPSSARAALDGVEAGGRGRGFIGVADDGRSAGDKLEVYTFLHGTADAIGATEGVRMALDHATRGATPAAETCGEGGQARVDFALTMLSRDGEVTRAAGTLAPVSCGRTIDARERFDPALMPVVHIGGR